MKEYYLKVVDALMVISKITIMRVFNVIILVQLAKLLLRTVLVAMGLIEKIISLLVVVKMVITITEQISIVYNVQLNCSVCNAESPNVCLEAAEGYYGSPP